MKEENDLAVSEHIGYLAGAKLSKFPTIVRISKSMQSSCFKEELGMSAIISNRLPMVPGPVCRELWLVV
jgi:hypothetical protein